MSPTNSTVSLSEYALRYFWTLGKETGMRGKTPPGRLLEPQGVSCSLILAVHFRLVSGEVRVLLDLDRTYSFFCQVTWSYRCRRRQLALLFFLAVSISCKEQRYHFLSSLEFDFFISSWRNSSCCHFARTKSFSSFRPSIFGDDDHISDRCYLSEFHRVTQYKAILLSWVAARVILCTSFFVADSFGSTR